MVQVVKLPDEIQKEAQVGAIASKLVRGVGRLFASAGDNVLSAFGRWWSKGLPKAEKILELKALKEIPNEIYEARLLNQGLGKEVNEITSGLTKSVEDIVKSFRRQMNVQGAELERFERTMGRLLKRKQSITAPEEMAKIDATIDQVQAALQRRQSLYDDAIQKYNEISSIYHEISKNPQGAATLLSDLPQVASKYNLNEWLARSQNVMNTKRQILEAASKNLNNDKRFVREYVEYISKLPNENPLKSAWLANPRNMAKLTELQMKPKYLQQIAEAEGRELKHADISGLTKGKIMKMLGIGAGAAGAIAGVAGLFSWASKSVEKVDQNAESLLSRLMGAQSSDLGEIILSNIQKSVNTISTESDNLKINAAKNPKEAFTKYFEILAAEKEKIDKNLRQWGAVVVGSNNPDEMRKLGEAVRNFSVQIEEELKNADKVIEGAGNVGRAPSIAPGGGSPNILKIQQYLKESNPSMSITGTLDATTIDALRRLEDRYNRLAETDRFTGLIYNPATRNIMSLEDLKSLEKVIT